jgi:hypothetical protein
MRAMAVLLLSMSTMLQGFAAVAAPTLQGGLAQQGQRASCTNSCTIMFNACLQVCGSNCTSSAVNAGTRPLPFRACDTERDSCVTLCQGLPAG